MLPIVAAVIGVCGVQTQRAVARRRATLDHLASVDADRDFIDARKLFIRLAKAPGGLAKWADDEHEGSVEVTSISLILNDFELVSVAIQQGIMDFEFYKLYTHGTVSKYWKVAAPFVHAVKQRKDHPTYHHEFEELACWIDENIRPPRKRTWLRKHFA